LITERRVNSLLTRATQAEYRHSRTRRLIANVRVSQRVSGQLNVGAKFAVYRVRSGVMDTYLGHYWHILVRDADSALRYVVGKSILYSRIEASR
jgi:p-cumate 2,3-dioxygenase beta subunit